VGFPDSDNPVSRALGKNSQSRLRIVGLEWHSPNEMKDCPKCRSKSPDNAVRCDCGYDFSSGTPQSLGAGDSRPSKTKTSRGRRIVAMVLGVLFIMGFLPMRYLASPRWEVWVVKKVDNQPLPGMKVMLDYGNYSAERFNHIITLTTDENGHALFQPTYATASLFQRVLYTSISALAGVHASFGRHATVMLPAGQGYFGVAVSGQYVTDWQGSPESMQSRIVAEPSARFRISPGTP